MTEIIKTGEKIYKVEEVHVGPPKSYITEKLIIAIEQQHLLISYIKEFAPDDIPPPWEDSTPDNVVSPFKTPSIFEGSTVKEVFFLDTARTVLSHLIKTFLALHDQLESYDENVVSNLEAGSLANLQAWIRRFLNIKDVSEKKVIK